MPSRGCACTTRRRAAANGGGGWTSVMIWCEPVKAQFTHAADSRHGQQDVCVRRLLAPPHVRAALWRHSRGRAGRPIHPRSFGREPTRDDSDARNKSTHAGGHTHAARRDGDNDRPGAARFCDAPTATGPRVIGLSVMCTAPGARVARLVGTRQGTAATTWDDDTALR